MKKELLQAVNDQINLELASAYLYLNMSIAMTAKNVNGFAHWLKAQYNEEVEHAEKLIAYVQTRNETPELKSVELIAVGDDAPLAVAKNVLTHEQLVTKSIHNLRKMAADHGDPALEIFLNWYVTEQVEEEENAQALVDLFTFVGDDKSLMFAADGKLGSR